MTKSVILIDAGVAMTRAALMLEGKVKRLWFGPASGDEHRYATPVPGQIYYARVLRTDRSLNFTFFDLGAGGQAMMRVIANEIPLEGRIYLVEATHMARGSKLPIVKIISQASEDAVLGPRDIPNSAFISALNAIAPAETNTIIISGGMAKAALLEALGKNEYRIKIDEECFAPIDDAGLMDEVFYPQVGLPSGGMITIDETEALTAIDIDSAAMGAPSRNRLNEKLNREAAVAIIDQLQLRMIGGQVVIDFLPMTKPVAGKFDHWLKNLCQALPGFGRAGWTPSGLFSFTLSRIHPSLLDVFTQTQEGCVIAGRDFTPDYVIRKALCSLEGKLRIQPSTQFRLSFPTQSHLALEANPQWQERLSSLFGSRAEFIHCPEYAFNKVIIDDLT